MITFEVKEYDVFVPKTPHPQQVFALIASYCASLFTTVTQFKRYVMNHLPNQGTELFIIGLRNPNVSSIHNELSLAKDNFELDDIVATEEVL